MDFPSVPIEHSCPTIDTIIGQLSRAEELMGRIESGDPDKTLYKSISAIFDRVKVEANHLRAMNLSLRTHSNRLLMEHEQFKMEHEMIINILTRKTKK